MHLKVVSYRIRGINIAMGESSDHKKQKTQNTANQHGELMQIIIRKR